MNGHIVTHRLSASDFRGLADGLGGARAVQALSRAEYSKHVLLLRAIAELAGSGSFAQRAYQHLARAQQRWPDRVAELISRPEVGAWATDCLKALREGEPGAAWDRLTRLADLAEPAVPRCRVEAGGMVLDVALNSEDPSLDRYRYDVDRADRAAWERRLAGAWRVLVENHRTQAEELAAGLHTVIPLRRVPHTAVVSATSPAAFGAVAASLPADDVTLAETLVHEFQHVKLGALLDMLLLVRPGTTAAPRYYAPWRNDPRPLMGLLQGTYAFFGVARFWRGQRRAMPGLDGHVEFARRRAETFHTTGTLLASGALTEDGTEFVSIMRDRLAGWLEEDVPASALDRAAASSAAHRSRWRPP
ncbi:aKG-HExxH-type peptide beta-hydroxylase [Spirillospora sp. CA-253888]